MGQGCRPAQLRRVTLGCAASEQVPGAGEGALTRHLERKCGFSRGKGVLVAGGQAEGREVLLGTGTGRECEVRGCGLLCPLSVAEESAKIESWTLVQAWTGVRSAL